MTMHPPTIETVSAHLILSEPWLIEQRYKRITTVTFENVRENAEARMQLSPGHPCAVLLVIPAEVAVNPPLANDDHFRDDRARSHILALAVVTDTTMMTTVSKMYFLFHPQAFETKVFEEEADARKWLATKLEVLKVG